MRAIDFGFIVGETIRKEDPFRLMKNNFAVFVGTIVFLYSITIEKLLKWLRLIK